MLAKIREAEQTGRTIQAALHRLRNGEDLAVTMVASVVFITRISRFSLSVELYFLIEIVNGVSFSNLK